MSDTRLGPNSTLIDAVQAIESSGRRMAVVLDEKNRLIGTFTDGDIRRWLLSGGTLDAPVTEAMHRSPVTALENAPPSYLLDLMRKANIMAIPLLNKEGHFKQLVHLKDLEQTRPNNTQTESEFEFAVIMAGGEGRRLRPLTDALPKPMVEIDGTPLLERQIENLLKAGLKKIYISVNYLSHIIENHFGDGSGLGVSIQYLRENEKLGTAGALGLLPKRPQRSIVVMNGDILTTSDFVCLGNFHETHGATVTVAAVDYRINIPYGVIESDGVFAKGLVEKPSQQFLCNAGIYAVRPEALEMIKEIRFFNMTDIIETCLANNNPVAIFPLHEYWSDIGTPDDLEKARAFFKPSNK